ncbi:MAG: hypothetical protein GIW99_02945 [Candidatus Eremiobacteraeota bacterium]|nr:hypothetical protein [Candidatus Eremiobacteraeota bacterium]MBC5826629.1 hypothetical protein [Candidatus Eremiobacteraeota bacterium]
MAIELELIDHDLCEAGVSIPGVLASIHAAPDADPVIADLAARLIRQVLLCAATI